MDYQNAKIYKIVSDFTDKIYIGSTCSPLSKRHYEHKQKSVRYTRLNKSYITSHELIKLGETQIELIEDYPCDRKEQLNAREAHYIRLYKENVVNKQMLGVDKEKRAQHLKQYKQENKETILEQHKQYLQANKEKIAEQKRHYNQSIKNAKINKILLYELPFFIDF